MSKRFFITIRTERSNERVDLEVPGNRSIHDLMPDLLKVLELPATRKGIPLQYSLKTEKDVLLTGEDTLEDAGVENAETLTITLLTDEAGAPAESEASKSILAEIKSRNTATLAIPPADLPMERGGVISPIILAQLPIEQPSLISPSGLIFILKKSYTLIGRTSNDNNPDIDLTELDTGIISSRKHAEITFLDGSFILKALKTTNGTFVNSVELDPDKTWTLKDKDIIQFGFRGVQLMYCVTESTI